MKKLSQSGAKIEIGSVVKFFLVGNPLRKRSSLETIGYANGSKSDHHVPAKFQFLWKTAKKKFLESFLFFNIIHFDFDLFNINLVQLN